MKHFLDDNSFSNFGILSNSKWFFIFVKDKLEDVLTLFTLVLVAAISYKS